MTKKIRQRILFSVVLAGVFYLAFSIYADFNDVLNSFKHFNWFLLPLLLVLSLLNYYSRFIKWNYYLGVLKIKIASWQSFSIFCSGLIMSITPGKFGELFKAYLLKQISNEPISKSAPIIFAERVTDFLSLVILSLIGAYAFDYGREIILIIGIIFLVGIIIIANKKIATYLLNLLSKISILSRYSQNFKNAYDSSHKLLSFMPLLKMTILSTVSWGFECVGYYLILSSFNINMSLLWASFAYAFATIVGAVSMLPGGLGVTEGSLSYLVMAQGFPKDVSFASTFIVRVVTLWFAVFIGIISVMFYQKKFGNINFESGHDEVI